MILLAGATGLHTIACETLAQCQTKTGCIRNREYFENETVCVRVWIHDVTTKEMSNVRDCLLGSQEAKFALFTLLSDFIKTNLEQHGKC